MAHELTIRTNSTTEMAFVGETPWHGLGQQLTEGASIEQWTVAAGMDWRIQRSKVRYFADAAGTDQRTWDDNHVLLRSDTKAPLGLVSPGYKTVQPRAVLEFFRDLTENAGYRLHTAGTLFGGRKFWALVKVAESYVTGADKIGGYLLLSASCDGSMATECRETTVRVVCSNTLSMAARGKGAIKVGHRSHFNADAVKARMQDSQANFATFIDQTRKLALIKVTNAMAEEFVRRLLRPNEAATTAAPVDGATLMSSLLSGRAANLNIDEGQDVKRAPKGEAEILSLFRGNAMGGTLLGTAGTAWGLVNAVTEYIDHRQSAKTDSHRLDRAFFGSGDELKTRAFDLAFTV